MFFTYLGPRAGSAVHALAQPTPLGNGPEGFFTVLNDAIIITEKVCRIVKTQKLQSKLRLVIR